MKENGQPRVAIVHDWLVGGGAERVVYELHQLFPDAPIYTSYATDEWRRKLDGKVVTGWLQHFGKLRKFLALGRIWWFTHLDFSGYDLVISSSGNGEAFGIRVPEGTLHVCYCHSPTHYYWRHYNQYMQRPGFGFFSPLARLGLKLLVGPLRKWDLKASKRPDYFIANSTHIQADIKKYYGRDSTVIFPPIDVSRFSADVPAKDRTFFVAVGRQVPQKFTHIIVEACTQLNLPLKVIGRGPEHDQLVRLAGPSVEFLTLASDAEVAQNMGGAKAFIFAAHDDFGITPVEAMAAGTPVIAYKAGGAFDYVVEDKTGEFFDEQTTASLVQVLQNFQPSQFDPKTIQAHAAQFSPEHFQQKLRTFLENLPDKI